MDKMIMRLYVSSKGSFNYEKYADVQDIYASVALFIVEDLKGWRFILKKMKDRIAQQLELIVYLDSKDILHNLHRREFQELDAEGATIVFV